MNVYQHSYVQLKIFSLVHYTACAGFQGLTRTSQVALENLSFQVLWNCFSLQDIGLSDDAQTKLRTLARFCLM